MLHLSLILFSITMLVSCNNSSSSLIMDFSDTSAGGRFARTASGDPYIGNFSLFDDAYELLGDQIDFSGKLTLTPSSFILPFTQASLGTQDSGSDINLSVPVLDYPESEWNDVSNVDFCNPISYEIVGTFEPNVYDSIFMRISSTQRPLGYNDGEIWETPIMEVTVPGYTDAEWPDLPSGSDYFIRKYLGANKFMIDLSLVLPKLKDANGNLALPIENYIFCSDYEAAGVIFPGLEGFPEYINTADYGYVSSTSSMTNLSALLLPFDKVDLSGNSTLIFYVEVQDILTVYDNGTPESKADDILILVKDYYKHFGVRSEITSTAPF